MPPSYGNSPYNLPYNQPNPIELQMKDQTKIASATNKKTNYDKNAQRDLTEEFHSAARHRRGSTLSQNKGDESTLFMLNVDNIS